MRFAKDILMKTDFDSAVAAKVYHDRKKKNLPLKICVIIMVAGIIAVLIIFAIFLILQPTGR